MQTTVNEPKVKKQYRDPERDLAYYYLQSGKTPKTYKGKRAVARFLDRYTGTKFAENAANIRAALGQSKNGTTDEARRAKTERQRRYRAKLKSGLIQPAAARAVTGMGVQAQVASLTQCPCCHAQFFYTMPS